MAGTTVVYVTPLKTTYPAKDHKFYKKKQEKKRRDMIIKKNRREKMEDNNIYSQREYGRHNGSKPFEIYDRFQVVDKDHLDVDQQFMTRKEYDYSIQCRETEWREFDDYMYGDEEEVRQKRARSESSEDETPPSKKRKESWHCHHPQRTRYQQAREARQEERVGLCKKLGITLRQLDIDDYWQAKKKIEETRHDLEIAIMNNWMAKGSREYLTDPYDSDDNWMAETSLKYLNDPDPFDSDY